MGLSQYHASMVEQWEVQRSEGKCDGAERTLEPGEEYYAALVDLKDRFERRDFSCDYWDEHKPEVYSFWKTQIPTPTEKKKLFVDDGVLVNFFERLANETDDLKVNFRFVLTLILMRKRIVKYEDTRSVEGKEIWKVRLVREKESHEVVNPQLDDEQVQQVSQELSAILQGDLDVEE